MRVENKNGKKEKVEYKNYLSAKNITPAPTVLCLCTNRHFDHIGNLT